MRLLHGLLLLSLLFLPLCTSMKLDFPGGPWRSSSKMPPPRTPPPAKAPTSVAGQWKPIGNMNNPHVKEIADFAVAEYNNKNGAQLKLEKVVKGETQAAAGSTYRLVLETRDEFSVGMEKYEVVLLEKPLENFKGLTSFDPIGE